ncbi:hypothetical protein Bca52824_039257 [Brassica carinata]|uniref:Uncharacterized protein n=1 Tax=Brassica carinata TaxID=52824 RepID=A0A8X7RR97_BRACI|nr:hypothetical protein Bca52824_039257 [Brassica carinata]
MECPCRGWSSIFGNRRVLWWDPSSRFPVPFSRSVLELDWSASWALEPPYRFRLIHSSLSFGGSCPAAVVVVSFLLCSVQIERLGSPEFRTDRHFGGSMYSIMDRGTFDSFFESSRLGDLRAPSQPAPID